MSKDADDSGASHIYLVGRWVETGPRANDVYFEVGYVTTDITLANIKSRDFTDAVIMVAKDNSSFCDWEERSMLFTS